MERNRWSQTPRGFGGRPAATFSSSSRKSNNRLSEHPNFRTLECKYYANGSCKAGDSCTYKHTGQPSASSNISIANNTSQPTLESTKTLPSKQSPYPPRICEHFMAKGTCRYGVDCKFAHALPNNDNGGKAEIHERPAALLFKLKGIMKSFSRLNEFQTLGKFEEFLDASLKVLDWNEIEIRAEAIQVLSVNDQHGADTTGYDVIKYLVDKIGFPEHPRYHLYLNPLRDLDYDRHIVPLMKILVHDAFTQSCVEKSFRFVIKAIYGPDGERGSKFLKKVVASLKEKSVSCNTEDLRTMLQENCLLVSRLLHYLVRYNAEAIGHADLIEVHAKLKELSVSVRTPLSARTDRYLAETAAHLIPLKLQPATERDPSGRDSALDIRYQQHEFLVDPPGELSNSGPRHDNDSARIAKISILPTKDEVLCLRDPYLPINDIAAPHFLDGAARLLDINFRLLREDMIGPLRNAVNVILQKLLPNVPISKQLSHQNHLREPNIVSTRLYFDVVVESAEFVKKDGLKFQLRLRQPRQTYGHQEETRRNYWEATRSLDKGSLLCLISSAPDFVCFLTVVEKQPKLLCKDPHWCWIDVAPEGKMDDIRESLLQHIRRNPLKDSLALVEFPGVLLAAYKAILESLRTRSQHPFMPFSNILCPLPDERQNYDPRHNQTVKVPPPLYASSEGFQFDLQALKHGGASPEPLFLSSEASPDDHGLLIKLERETTLDFGQCKGLIAALTQEVALIQGPPGTGKTYLGVEIVKVLLHNKISLRLKPIICVCYTNHALDQFLEHLLPITKRIVRMGSMSKSEKLDKYNLYEWVNRDDGTKTRAEGRMEYDCHNAMELQLKDGNELCDSLCHGTSKIQWNQLDAFLNRNYPAHHAQLMGGVDHDGFVKVGKKRGTYFYYWKFSLDLRDRESYEKLHGNITDNGPTSSSRPLTELLSSNADIWEFSRDERTLILRHWDDRLRQDWIDEIVVRAQGYQDESEKLVAVRSECYRRLLERVDVIGLTTTGLARYAPLLDRIESKTLICEEAGESHTLTALLPSIEHCILIGDHMQLRPHIQNHELSAENHRRELKYNLDISLFERLCSSGVRSTTDQVLEFPFAQLNVQRRMRPDIADLVRRPLYPKLEDHTTVQDCPPVPGMYHHLYWLDHSHRESGSGEFDIKGTSHSNDYEVQMVKQVVSHLSKQGCYRDGELAVITPYVGQLRKLRNELRNTFSVQLSEKDQEEVDTIDELNNGNSSPSIERRDLSQSVRIATVDNFQGEEAKVIVVSLVRSNENGNVGFLKTSNRINVLLSRAQHGMYIIGDAKCASSVKMWKEVIEILTGRDQLGPTLRLKCPRHQETIIVVTKPEDFEILSPEGGCTELCGERLDCGHSCEFQCHAEARHRVAGCRKPCERGRPECGHGCPKRCSDPCGNCNVAIKNVNLPCGHSLPELACCKVQDLGKSKPKCHVGVKRTLPQCGHEVDMECWQSTDDFKCKIVCGGEVQCRHQICANLCYGCPIGIDGMRRHAPCRKICDKDFTTCSHRCARSCHAEEDCGLCTKRCELRCIHSQCPGKCGEQCVPCAEPCTWFCEHRGRCNMPCGAPCNRLPCNLRCDSRLECGHQCPSMCGEPCPGKEFCQQCCTPKLKETVVEYLELTNYEDINLDIDPIAVLPCNHFFSRSSLDRSLEIDKVYILDDNDRFVECIPNGSMSSQHARCPLCRSTISQVQRYNRVTKRAVLDGLLKNIIIRSQSQYLTLAMSFDELKLDMDASREESLSKFRPVRNSMQNRPLSAKNGAVIVERMKIFEPLKSKIRIYLKEVDESRQPHMKVYRMSIAAKSRAKADVDDISGVDWPLDVPSPQVKHRLLGYILESRLEVLRNAEMIQFVDRLPSAGFNDDAAPLYRKVIKECASLQTKLSKRKAECDEHQYNSLAVEMILVQTDLMALAVRASQVGDKSKAQRFLDIGLKLLDTCETYLQKFHSCRKYEPAVVRAREMLRARDTFYESVSQEERSTIYQAMQGDFGSAVRWYYCRNRHPFTVGECGRPMEETTCPECGEPVGGRNHNPAAGVREAVDIR